MGRGEKVGEVWRKKRGFVWACKGRGGEGDGACFRRVRVRGWLKGIVRRGREGRERLVAWRVGRAEE